MFLAESIDCGGNGAFAGLAAFFPNSQAKLSRETRDGSLGRTQKSSFLKALISWAKKRSMTRLTIDLDEDTLKAVEAAAKVDGKSISGWARDRLTEASRTEKEWPHRYFETIAGFGGTEIEEPPEVIIPLDQISLESK